MASNHCRDASPPAARSQAAAPRVSCKYASTPPSPSRTRLRTMYAQRRSAGRHRVWLSSDAGAVAAAAVRSSTRSVSRAPHDSGPPSAASGDASSHSLAVRERVSAHIAGTELVSAASASASASSSASAVASATMGSRASASRTASSASLSRRGWRSPPPSSSPSASSVRCGWKSHPSTHRSPSKLKMERKHAATASEHGVSSSPRVRRPRKAGAATRKAARARSPQATLRLL
mmetsp:Transcript_19250/g.61264  ORF Transcript_19250/g.61264 Transcript_19250/m.61264 type:complete len:233 (-) Transcript_19250:157-855(-)